MVGNDPFGGMGKRRGKRWILLMMSSGGRRPVGLAEPLDLFTFTFNRHRRMRDRLSFKTCLNLKALLLV